VCYGIGKAFNIEPIWIRLLFIILFFAMPFFVVVAYVVAALVMKEEPINLPTSPRESGSDGSYTKVENGIKRFFDMLYRFGEKVINALK
jgi:phage shock protein PspC (stress-responsive transcriptional regulator)